jgi:hypothetical protein
LFLSLSGNVNVTGLFSSVISIVVIEWSIILYVN